MEAVAEFLEGAEGVGEVLSATWRAAPAMLAGREELLRRWVGRVCGTDHAYWSSNELSNELS